MRVDKEIRKVEIGEGKRMESFTRGEIDIRDSRCGQEMLRRPAISDRKLLGADLFGVISIMKHLLIKLTKRLAKNRGCYGKLFRSQISNWI